MSMRNCVWAFITAIEYIAMLMAIFFLTIFVHDNFPPYGNNYAITGAFFFSGIALLFEGLKKELEEEGIKRDMLEKMEKRKETKI